jgi:hypothetical protein
MPFRRFSVTFLYLFAAHQNACRDQPAGPHAFLGGVKNHAVEAEGNLSLRK